jgi:hypothetical protein
MLSLDDIAHDAALTRDASLETLTALQALCAAAQSAIASAMAERVNAG